jgi:hypothetical protein
MLVNYDLPWNLKADNGSAASTGWPKKPVSIFNPSTTGTVESACFGAE